MVYVDRELCIGCGACADICPEGFEMRDDDKAYAVNPDANCIDEAMEACPVEAIKKDNEINSPGQGSPGADSGGLGSGRGMGRGAGKGMGKGPRGGRGAGKGGGGRRR